MCCGDLIRLIRSRATDSTSDLKSDSTWDSFTQVLKLFCLAGNVENGHALTKSPMSSNYSSLAINFPHTGSKTRTSVQCLKRKKTPS